MLTSVAEGPDQLLLELDSHMLLVFSGPTAVDEALSYAPSVDGARILTLSGFSRCMVVHLKKGGHRSKSDIYEGGIVQFTSART